MSEVSLRRLLLATERTEFDTGAERIAIALAERLGCRLEAVLPVPSNPEYLGTAPDVALRAEREAVAALDDLRAQARAAGVAVDASVQRGEQLWQEIVAAATRARAQLLVTRRIGRRGLLARLLVGEMVSQVAARAPCAQLMVAATATGLWSQRVLVAQDDALGQAGQLAAQLARTGGARLLPCLAQDLAHAEAHDLVVLGIGASRTTGGRLDRNTETLIGGLPCPVLLVRESARIAGD